MRKFRVFASYKNSTARTIEANFEKDAVVKYAEIEHKTKDDVSYVAGLGTRTNKSQYHINTWGTVFSYEID